jgi:primosomal protein N''
MLQVAARSVESEPDFARARHFDLQRYLKEYAACEDPHMDEVKQTLDALQANAPDLSERLANRAIAVSVALAAWELRVRDDPTLAKHYGEFVLEFLKRLKYQADRLKKFRPDPRYPYLIDFQRHLTQAAVEKPAVRYRHEKLIEQFDHWRSTGELTGDELPVPDDED